MHTETAPVTILETAEIRSEFLDRQVTVDFYFPDTIKKAVSLFVINDGQDMEALGLQPMLEKMTREKSISPVFCAAVHAGDRMMEFGTAAETDYKGRGRKAAQYTQFVLKELVPAVEARYPSIEWKEKAIGGFSMGGLSALDIAWNHPADFSKAGIFSGSLWWRSKGLDEGYQEETDRIMHAQIRNRPFAEGLKFFFEAGTLDETMDRNNNGIIDAIDDTLALIDELVQKGYRRKKDICYLQLEEGRHDVATWARAMPEFLRWAWGKKPKK